MKNLRKICKECSIYQQVKPPYYQLDNVQLIKSTQPFECLSIDFKGPLPSRSNPFLLTIVDEYSRFPFAFPVKNIATSAVIEFLRNLFFISRMPGYLHSDQSPSFMSHKLKAWLFSKGITSSCTIPYNPTGNSQVERYNGIVWKSVLLALKSHNMPTTGKGSFLPDVLHSIYTATNCTPHECMFNFHRCSDTGQSVPSWLMHPGIVLMHRISEIASMIL